VQTVKPVLERNDLPELMTLFKSRWTAAEIVSFLVGQDCDARKVAALALGLVGGKCCLQELARQLRDPDPMVNQMVEHAMWSIWFRAGTDEANHHLCRGAKAIERGDYQHAIKHFNQAIELCPDFPEAYNQRALAKYLMERLDESILDCRKAVYLMPIHFGAWAGMGHCHAHHGCLAEAVECYERALSINPHMTQIHEAIGQLRSRIGADVH